MIKTINFIYNHPLNKNKRFLSVLNFLKWQIISRLWKGYFVFNWIENSKLVITNGMTGATGNMYVGLMEYEDMSFLLHYLQKDDLFYDIGANVGVYTVLASKVKKAKTIAFEPLPNTFEKLIDNIQVNRLGNVIAKNIGLSYEKSKLFFTINRDTMNRVALESDINIKEVEVDTIDNISGLFGIPNIVKIDVEGYESNVLKGAKEILKSNILEVIIIELNGNGEKFGFNDDDTHNDLLDYGFLPYTYNPFTRKIIKLDSYGPHNTIYIKDSAYVKVSKILKNSQSFNCNGMSI